ncbi:SRPBCC family protein [Thermocatellispora tengchongensis]|uniref:SRPBCC family protein n=1 Tax=Thermocatellispora tengchongensis TaxID=1073253 RepID=UPI003629EF9C
MRTVGVRAHVPLNASDALARLRDGSWRTRLPGDVVSVRDAGDAEEWTVRFGRGAVRWRQREAGAEPSAVAFEQVDGDFAKLSVTWTCEPAPSTACQVNFEARFDLGVPMHDRVFEPSWPAHSPAPPAPS